MDYLIQLDHQLFNFINQGLSNDFFDWVMPIIRNKKTWIPFYIIGAGLLYRLKGKKSLFIILTVLLAVGMADGFSSHVMKPFFERTRPCLLPELASQVQLVVERCSGAYSFPSSHAANHFAIAFLLSFFLQAHSKLTAWILLFWASLICFAQLYVGVHFPSDILAGSMVGLIAAMIAYWIYTLLNRKFNWK